MNYNVIFCYTVNDKVKYIRDDDDLNTIREMDRLDLNKPELAIHYFTMMGDDYTLDRDGLIHYKNDFNREHKEILNEWIITKSGKKHKLDYKKYYNHNNAVSQYFLSKTDKTLINSFMPINEQEFYILEQCYNAGLITINDKYKNELTECYGVDFSRYYTHLFLDIKIPFGEGKIKTINELSNNLEFGIYRVKITYSNEDFTNVFNFSKTSHYTSSTLKALFEIQDDYGLKFELLQPDEDFNYNCLIYDNDCLINGKKIFNDWYKSLENIRKKYPKNKLIKFLMSSLWGILCGFKKVYIPREKEKEYDMTHKTSVEPSEYKIIDIADNGDYITVDTKDPYKYNLARIKPFLTGFGRLKILKLLHNNDLVKNVVRIHTDGITLNKNVDFSKLGLPYNYYPSQEDKTTGLMLFKNAVYGFHLCSKCNQLFSYEDFKIHKNNNKCEKI